MQAFAKFEYLGWFNLGLKCYARNKQAITEIIENIDNNKDLVVSLVSAQDENKSQVSLRWDW